MAKASLEAQDNDQWTPLHFAARHGHTEAIKILAAAGAMLEAQDEARMTPLDLAPNEATRQALVDHLTTLKDAHKALGSNNGSGKEEL